jgi:hypothetical protein
VSDFQLKDSGKRETFDTGAKRDIQENKGRYDLLPMHALFRLSRIFEEGAKKYDEDNWRKGIPLRRYANSALRHLCRHIQGARDEDHAVQAAWNIMCMVETKYMIDQGLLPKELDNLPSFVGENDPQILNEQALKENRKKIEDATSVEF